MGYAICEDIRLSQIRLVYKLPINKIVAACGQQSVQNVCKMNLSKKKKKVQQILMKKYQY